MPASSDFPLVLAGQLSELSDAALAELLEAREVQLSGIRDYFDLAEALLEPASIQHALGRLDRPTLAALAAVAELTAATEADVTTHLEAFGARPTETGARLGEAQRRALLTRSARQYLVPESVATQLREWPGMGLPSLAQLASDQAPAVLAAASDVSSRTTDRLAAEHAFAAVACVAELLWAASHGSFRALARGGISLPDTKRLAAAMRVDAERVAELVRVCERAGLIALTGGRWGATAASAHWLASPSPQRWAVLAAAWVERLPDDVSAMLGARSHAAWGQQIEEFLAWYYPAGGEWMTDRVRVYTRDAELLGITASHVPSTAGIALLTAGPAVASDVIAGEFPAETRQVYLQHDLTVVSTGPLAPDVDARLRGFADVEGHALASSYRVSTPSLYRALAMGETAETLTAFLNEIALTGIPQPLKYVVAEAVARHGLIRVGAIAGELPGGPDGALVDAVGGADGAVAGEPGGALGGGLHGRQSYVRSTDDTMIRTLLVDHSLASLRLTRMGDRLVSNADPGQVLATLSQSRYPVVAENSAGEMITLPHQPAAAVLTSSDVDAISALIERLRFGGSPDAASTSKAWLSRQLDAAIRAKVALTVTVQMPDGAAIEYELEPSSVAGGRLRARDRRADIERTLPVASITAVAPAP